MKKVYLIGNAHIDPVWLWRKTEGLAEIKATFRSALDRMKEFPDWVFTCACACYYEWIEAIDPKMFKEIQQRVSEERWSIVGGFWIQPDCNLPSGESFARQALYSQLYFKEKFGRIAESGYNIDSFGHNGMMPQLLKQSGMNAYVYMRPGIHEKPSLEPFLFEWQSPDGSTVTAYRLPHNYNHSNDHEDITSYMNYKLEDISRMFKENGVPHMCFFGVGNHGGGPTVFGLKMLEERIKDDPDITYASVYDYFNDARNNSHPLPLFQGDLQHHAIGCYSAESAVKAANRRAENSILTAERYNVLSGCLLGISERQTDIKQGWKKILFNQFHDILAGCCIRDAYTDAIDELRSACADASRLTELALQRISWNIHTTRFLDSGHAEKNGWVLWEKEGEGAPLIVFNPHSFTVHAPVQINTKVSCVSDRSGVHLPVQIVRGPQTNGEEKYNTLFTADLPALGYNTYYLFKDQVSEVPVSEYATSAYQNILENEYLRIEFNPANGNIISFFDKRCGKELVGEGFAVPTVYDDEENDTWAHNHSFIGSRVGVFTDAELSVLENGPLRSAIRVSSVFGGTTLQQDFYLTALSDSVEVRCVLYNQEKHKIIRLNFETDIKNPSVTYSMPYGFLNKPANGEEEPSQRWAAISNADGHGLAVINAEKYSFSAKDNTLRMIISRSCLYADHYGKRDQQMDFMEQGEQRFIYLLTPFDSSDITPVVKLAAILNQPPAVVMETHHEGVLGAEFEGIKISADNVLLETLKYAEDNEKDLILRLYEAAGRPVDAKIRLTKPDCSFELSFRTQQIVTVRISADGSHVAVTNFLEFTD